MNMFRQLTPDEEKEFRAWARDNYVRLQPIKGIWHPIVQDECGKMNAELTEERPPFPPVPLSPIE